MNDDEAESESVAKLRLYVDLARVDHWFKNVFLVAGVVVAFFFDPALLDASDVGRLLLGGGAVCVLASSNYVLNELLDAATDREHPAKRHRPLASGRASRTVAWLEWAVLGVLGILLAFLVGKPFGAVAVCFAAAAWIYNVPGMRTKDLPYLDVVTEAVNLPLRVLLGWFVLVADRFPPVSLLLAFWAAGAFFMATKRLAELPALGSSEAAGRYRRSFRHYTQERLLLLICFAVFCCAFFAGAFAVRFKLELVLFAPAMAAFFVYYLRLGLRDAGSAQFSEKLCRDWGVVLGAATCVVVFVVLMLTDIPILYEWLDVEPASDTVLWRLG